ncbi:MAG: hypothetical protein ACLQGU_06815 [bacterium]
MRGQKHLPGIILAITQRGLALHRCVQGPRTYLFPIRSTFPCK